MRKILCHILAIIAVLLVVRPGYSQADAVKPADICADVKEELRYARSAVDDARKELLALKVVSAELDAARQALGASGRARQEPERRKLLPTVPAQTLCR